MSDQNSSTNLPTISAEELHRICLSAFRIGNRARRKLIAALLALHESKLYLTLGFSSIAQYAEKHFGYRTTQTFESLRVARALPDLPGCTEEFTSGAISWSVLREITRIASKETETEWIRFSKEHTFKQLKVEVQDALKKNRKVPRKDGFSLPNLTVELKFKLTLEEYNLVRKALEKIAGEMKGNLGEDGPSLEPEKVLLYIMELILETDPSLPALPAGGLDARTPKDESIFTILYRLCPRCRKEADVATEEGPVEVPVEHVERIECESKKVEIKPEEEIRDAKRGQGIDPPNSSALTRKVRLRDGGRCANPYCRRLGEHAHHVVYRWRGGPTAVWNEISVCTTCHRLLHLSLLVIEEGQDGKLQWIRRADGIVLDPKDEKEDASVLPLVIPNYTIVNSPVEEGDLEKRLTGIESKFREIGIRGPQAEKRVRQAYENLIKDDQAEPSDDKILRAALANPAA